MQHSPSSNNAIGVFDSGVGGLTVMRQITQVLPLESFIYFGDTARIPYGTKSRETIIRYSLENAHFLMEHQVKMIVVACHTASAYSIDFLKKELSIPVIDVITAGVTKVVQTTKNGRIGILGTKATVKSGIYESKLKEQLPHAAVFSVPCPLFVPLVEEHWLDHAATSLIVKEYLAPLKNKGIDTVLLGCTHYPLLKLQIEKELGPDISVIDSGETCGQLMIETLREKGIANQTQTTCHQYFVSDDPERFCLSGELFLGSPIACSLKH